MPWRCSSDKGDLITGAGAGRVFCPDVGTDVFEEVNLLENGGNYGYPLFEGDVCIADNQTCDAGQLKYCIYIINLLDIPDCVNLSC